MIASVGSRIVAAGQAAGNAGFAGRPQGPARAAPPRRAPPPEREPQDRGTRPGAQRRGPALDDFARDPEPLPLGARTAAAARAFSAGNGYLSGLLVDRLA